MFGHVVDVEREEMRGYTGALGHSRLYGFDGWELIVDFYVE
jgi:hypothetical protein